MLSNRPLALSILLILVVWGFSGAVPSTAQDIDPSLRAERALEHNSPDWALIATHLPDPATATPAKLEMEGDVLRARRFPVDALDYFRYALNRGGDRSVLLNKMGVTELELGNVTLARLYIQAGLKAQRKNGQAWNNLGAIEFMQRHYGDAIRDYKRAIKYDDRVAVYHSNLGLAYVDKKDFESARAQLILALKLDPDVFLNHNAAGSSLHILSTSDRAEFCLEMAKAYAKMGNEAEMLHALQTASEAGMDIQAAMAKDRVLAAYVNDPQVVALVHVGKSLHASRVAGGNVVGAAPPLPTPAVAPPAPTPR